MANGDCTDFSTGWNGNAIGIEITAPVAVPLDRLNQLLGETPLSEHDYLPVRAA